MLPSHCIYCAVTQNRNSEKSDESVAISLNKTIIKQRGCCDVLVIALYFETKDLEVKSMQKHQRHNLSGRASEIENAALFD